MNKINRSIFLMLFIIIYLNSYSQTTQKRCVDNKLIEYLISVNQLKNINDSKDQLTNYIYSHEIIDRTMFGDKINSIYVFGANTSHTPTYFLLKKNNSFKILSAFNKLETLDEVIQFLKGDKCKNNNNLKYIKSVIEIIENNSHAMYFNDSLVKTNWFDCTPATSSPKYKLKR